ncbi:MAG: hypothetical protein DWQ07_12875 [Chloroflexi bacterium]|nr:MAG: hypothetical protein DWQ07_12875 [Chloroflexota bacterium]MBL1196933.1 hypothetical protein [Chloroflexota bacterium]
MTLSPNRYENQPSNSRWWLILSLAFLIGFLLAGIVVINGRHAVDRHGAEATAIRTCIDNNGPTQIWMSRDKRTFYQICQLEDGRWGLQAIIKKGQEWFEKTAFVKGDGSWQALMRYLGNIATKYNGTLP